MKTSSLIEQNSLLEREDWVIKKIDACIKGIGDESFASANLCYLINKICGIEDDRPMVVLNVAQMIRVCESVR